MELSYIFGSNSGWSLLASRFSVQESYGLTGFGQNCVPSFNAFFCFVRHLEHKMMEWRQIEKLNFVDRTISNMADRINLTKTIVERANTLFKMVHDGRNLKVRIMQ